jgi:hypothetical protein
VPGVVALIQLMQLVDGLTETVSKHIGTVKGTHAVLIPLLGRLCSLSSILGTLKTQLESNSGNPNTLHYLDDPLRTCGAVLALVKSRLDNLKTVAGCVIGPVLDKQTTNQLKRLEDLLPILQLALDADNLASTRAIEGYVQALQLDTAEQAQILRYDIEVHHQDAIQWREEDNQLREIAAESQLRERVFSWLLLVDSTSNYLAACQRQQPGTGQWLLESPEFLNWKNGNEPFLWLNATGS